VAGLAGGLTLTSPRLRAGPPGCCYGRRWAGGVVEVVPSDPSSIARSGPVVRDIDGGALYAERATPTAVGDYYLARDAALRSRLTLRVRNRWPLQLELRPDDLVVVTERRLGLVNQRFIVSSLRTVIDPGGCGRPTTRSRNTPSEPAARRSSSTAQSPG